MAQSFPPHFKWITYRGKKILLNNYKNMSGEESVPLIKEGVEYIKDMADPSTNLLIDVTNALDTQHTQLEFRKASIACKPYINKVAVIGITPLKAILLKAINKFSGINAMPFSDESKAKEWLIS